MKHANNVPRGTIYLIKIIRNLNQGNSLYNCAP